MKNKNNEYLCNMYCSYEYSIGLGTIPEPKLHGYHMIEILIGNKRPVNLITENGTYEDYVLLVRPDILHAATDIEKEMVIIIMDPESDLALKLAAKYLGNKDVVPLTIKRDMRVIKNYFDNPTVENAVKIYNSVINSLKLSDDIKIHKDQRVLKTVDYIRNLEIKKVSTKEIAKYVGLSEGRLIHLFKDQVGIPIRRYLLWRRINDAVYAHICGSSPTCAAHAAEFADYAHLSRNFSMMFGNSLSEVFKYAKFHSINSSL
jgi:AraC-like DNA-binding protein